MSTGRRIAAASVRGADGLEYKECCMEAETGMRMTQNDGLSVFFIVSQNTEKKSDSENWQKGERTKR